MSTDDAEDGRFDFETVERIRLPEGDDEALFYRRTAKRAPRHRLISKSDIADVAMQGIMAAIAVTRPPGTWPGFCSAASRFNHGHVVRKRLGPFRDALRAVLGDVPDSDVEKYFDQWWDGLHRRRMMLIRELVGGGPVKFTLSGREHLDAAAALGRGVILWAGQFTSMTLAAKRGLFEAGFHAHQVSARFHGFRDTWFGNRFVNQLLVRAENRYLAGRLILEGEEGGMVIRKVMRLLETGAPMIFTNNLYAGRSFVQMPFGAAGFIGMPTTPIALALRGQVPLLFFSTIEREPLAHYEIRISADLTAQEHGGGQAKAASQDFRAMARVALKARDALLAAVRTAPDQYLDWPPLARPVVGRA